jgi:hypothetical protein
MARPYVATLADYTPKFPGEVFDPQDVRDEDFDGVAVVNEAFVVPALADSEGRYRVILDRVPMDQLGTTVAITGDGPRIPVPYGEAVAVGRVGVSLVSGVLEFHADDAGSAGTASYTGRGTSVGASMLSVMGAELKAVQEAAQEIPSVVERLESWAGVVVLDPVAGDDTWDGSPLGPVASSARVMELLEEMTGRVRVVLRGGAELVIPTRWDGSAWEAWPVGLELFFEGEGERGTVVVELGTVEMEATIFNEQVEILAPGIPIVGGSNVAFDVSVELVDVTDDPESYEPYSLNFVGLFSGSNHDWENSSLEFAVAGASEYVSGDLRIAGSERGRAQGVTFTASAGRIFYEKMDVLGSVFSNNTIGVDVRLARCVSSGSAQDVLEAVACRFLGAVLGTSDALISSVTAERLSGKYVWNSVSAGDVTADEVRGCVSGGNVTADEIDDLRLVGNGVRTLTARVIRNLVGRSQRVRWVPTEGSAFLDGFDIEESVGGAPFVDINGRTTGSVAIRNGQFVYTGNWEESTASPAGRVMMILHRNSTAPLYIQNVQYRGTCQFLYRSHPNPALDPNRDTRAAYVLIENCDLRWIAAGHATVPNDTRGVILQQGRGLVEVVNSYLENDQRAMTADSDSAGCIGRVQAGSGGFTGGTLSAGGVAVALKFVGCHFVYKGRTSKGGPGGEHLFEVVTNASADPVNKSLDLWGCSAEASSLGVVVAGTGTPVTVYGTWTGPNPDAEAGTVTWSGVRARRILGVVEFPDAVSEATAAVFGGDAKIWRDAAGVLRTSGDFVVGSDTANKSILVRGRNVFSGNVQVGEFVSVDYGGTKANNNIVLRALDNSPGANIRIEVLDANTHIGFNRGGLANSQVTVMRETDISDGHINVRAAVAADGSDFSKQSVLIQETSDWRHWNRGGGKFVWASGANKTDVIAELDSLGLTPNRQVKAAFGNVLHLLSTPDPDGDASSGRAMLLEAGRDGSGLGAIIVLQHVSGNIDSTALAGEGATLQIYGKGKVRNANGQTHTPANRELMQFDMRSTVDSGDAVWTTAKAGTGSDRNIRIKPATLAAYIHGSVTLVARSATGVPNNSIFLDSADNVLKKKNNSGTVSNL